ncbi:MAG TPA: arsenate reductase ArsC [Thermoanaerobaculia bacterium]|nr:arsenate reductase ArsC [Thermoanaerobaculia bacterium]
MTDSKKTILFLCTGNAARSQMAEALARLDYGDLVEPVSAGSRPARFVHELAVAAMAELGVSLEEAYSKSADEFHDARLDLVVTVCDSAAADCPVWPGARHIVHWSVEDPSFVPGDAEVRLAAFRVTRDDLRRRIDGLMEALRHSIPKRSDRDLLESGAKILEGMFRAYDMKFEGVEEKKTGHRHVVRGRFARRGRAVELQVKSGVVIAEYQAGDRSMRHPDYMDALGAAGAMRYPGLSKDPLDAFRRLRADLIRHARPFLTGKGLKEFERLARPPERKKGPLKTA